MRAKARPGDIIGRLDDRALAAVLPEADEACTREWIDAVLVAEREEAARGAGEPHPVVGVSVVSGGGLNAKLALREVQALLRDRLKAPSRYPRYRLLEVPSSPPEG